ncbi:MAG: twin-arginine translocase subunit TatC [Planctomycetia bacterium]|nr:twin-arginine translocase subunit TatC [Planctomycetia bacterium]
MPAKKSDDDLFAETTMTFGEHLEELRVCLWRAIVGLVIGTIGGFFLGDYVVAMIERPLKIALKDYYRTAAEAEYEKWSQEQTAIGRPIPYTLDEVKRIARPQLKEEKELIFELEFVHPSTLQDSLDSLRIPAAAKPGGGEDATKTTEANPTDLVPGDVKKVKPDEPKAADGKTPEEPPSRYNRANLAPLLLWHPLDSDPRFKLQGTGVSEVFTVWLKAALVVGVLVSSPWVFYQIWMFVASGLYPTERKYVYMFLPFSLGLFFLGAATAYLFVFEPVLNFLLGFNQSLGIDPDPKISEWLGFVLLLPLGFGVSFQLPLVMLFLERIGVLSVNVFLEKWRIAVLVIFVISAILTPADPYSIFLMALPLTVLYFLGILLAKYLPKN